MFWLDNKKIFNVIDIERFQYILCFGWTCKILLSPPRFPISIHLMFWLDRMKL